MPETCILLETERFLGSTPAERLPQLRATEKEDSRVTADRPRARGFPTLQVLPWIRRGTCMSPTVETIASGRSLVESSRLSRERARLATQAMADRQPAPNSMGPVVCLS